MMKDSFTILCVVATLTIDVLCTMTHINSTTVPHGTQKLMSIAGDRYALWNSDNDIIVLNSQFAPIRTIEIPISNGNSMTAITVSRDLNTVAGVRDRELCWHNFATN